MMLISWFHRIPTDWVALVLAAIAGSLYLKYSFRTDDHLLRASQALRDRIYTTVFVYVLVSRFSGVLLHLSVHWRTDLLSLLAGPSQRGWLAGSFAVAMYLWFTLRRRAGWAWVVAEGTVAGAILFFAWQAAVNLPPFRYEALVRMGAAVILVLWARWLRSRAAGRPQWLFGGLAAVAFLTSAWVPQLDRMGPLSVAQWVFLLGIAASLAAELRHDVTQSTSSDVK